MTSNMIYIVAFGIGIKCPHKIHLNTQCTMQKNIIKTFVIYFSVCGQSEDDRRAVSNYQFSDGNVNTTISKVRLRI